jgi:hypothetical protein
MSFRPLGWYWITDLSSRYVVFLISRSNQLFWCVFRYLLYFWFLVSFECWEFLWSSGVASRNSGIKSLICAASIFCASLFFYDSEFVTIKSAFEVTYPPSRFWYITNSFTEMLDLTLGDNFGVLYTRTFSFGYHHYIVGMQQAITSTPATWWTLHWVSLFYIGWFWKIKQNLRFLIHNLTSVLNVQL